MKNRKIEELDTNFKITGIKEEGKVYFDVTQEPSIVFGLPWFKSNKEFCRMPPEKLKLFSEGIKYLSWNTTGVRLRFKTNSPSIALKVNLLSGSDMSHMPRTGISGFDFYTGLGPNKKYVKTIMPESGAQEYQGEVFSCDDDGLLKEWLIYFPLYNGVKRLQLGIKEGSIIEPADQYIIEKPVVFYGSSITQGGCASRTGNCYTNIISRLLDTDIYNLGFSGSAKGEPEMAEFISELEMSVLVIDYDHNAPDVKHLEKTHEPFFKCIRRKQPELPVIFVSKPDFDANISDSSVRREIIYRTYKNSLDLGDKRTYFIDGETLFGKENRDSCTVDGCHPNDLGFMRMAKVIAPVIKNTSAFSGIY